MQKKPNASRRRALLPWSSGSERWAFLVGASGVLGGFWTHGAAQEESSVTDCSLLSLPVATSFSFPSSNLDSHYLTPHSLSDQH